MAGLKKIEAVAGRDVPHVLVNVRETNISLATVAPGSNRSHKLQSGVRIAVGNTTEERFLEKL